MPDALCAGETPIPVDAGLSPEPAERDRGHMGANVRAGATRRATGLLRKAQRRLMPPALRRAAATAARRCAISVITRSRKS